MSRITAVLTIALMCVALFAVPAWAADSSFDPPVPDAELVSRDTITGAEAVQSMLRTVESVDVNPEGAVVTVNDSEGPHSIALDVGDLLEDKRTAGVGYFAGAYVGLGVLARLARVLRALLGA